MLVFIVGPAITWTVRHAAKERRCATTSTTSFTVQAPLVPRFVIMACAIASELLMLGVYIWQGLAQNIWDGQLAWLGHALALTFLLAWAFLSASRIDVSGDKITARSLLRRRHTTTFDRIDKAEIDFSTKSLALFSEDRKVAKISLEYQCIDNLIERLDRERIPLSNAAGKPATKRKLCWTALKPLTITFWVIAAAASGILVFMCIFADMEAKMLWLIPGLFVLTGVVLPLCMLTMPLRGLYLLALQEHELGFSFAKDMSEENATGIPYESQRWFVDVSNARIVAFRRDYLKSVSSAKKGDAGDWCIATAKNGRKHKVHAAEPTLQDLRRWFAQDEADALCARTPMQ